MSLHRLVLSVGVIVMLGTSGIVHAADQATPFDFSNGQVNWTDLENQGGGILGWSDASSGAIGGGGDHFDDAMGIRVGGAAYTDVDGTIDVVGNVFTADTQALAGLNVTVQFQASAVNPIMRQLVQLSNPTGGTINTTLSWINNTGNDSGQVVIGSSSGDTLFATNDTSLVTADNASPVATNAEANVWSLGSPTGGLRPTSVSLLDGEAAFGTSSDDGVRANFNISVPAGQTRYLMFFVGSPGTNANALTLAGQFDANNAALMADLFAGLTPAQQALILNWVALNLQAVATNSNQTGTATALNNAFTMGRGAGLQATLSGLPAAGQRQVLQNTVPQAKVGLTDARTVTHQRHNMQVNGRLHKGRQNVVRAKQQDDGLPSAAIVSLDATAAATAMAMTQTNPEAGSTNLSFWMQTTHFFGDVDSDSNAAGYAWNSHGGAVGLDRRYGENMILGASIFAQLTDLDGRDGSGEADANVFGINAYGSYFRDAWHIDAGLGYSIGLNQTERPTGLPGVEAHGDYLSHGFNASLLGGYVFTPLEDKTIEIEPQVGVDYTMIYDEQYSETGGGALSLTVDDEVTHSLRSLIGFKIAKVFETESLGTFRGAVGAGWRHEFLDNETNVTASVLGASFTARGVERSRDSAQVSVSVDWRINDSIMVYAQYAPEFADGWHDHSFTVGLRKDF